MEYFVFTVLLLQVNGDFQPTPQEVTNKVISAQKPLIAVAQNLAEVLAVAPPDNWEFSALSVAEDLRKLKDLKRQEIAQQILDAVFWLKWTT